MPLEDNDFSADFVHQQFAGAALAGFDFLYHLAHIDGAGQEIALGDDVGAQGLIVAMRRIAHRIVALQLVEQRPESLPRLVEEIEIGIAMCQQIAAHTAFRVDHEQMKFVQPVDPAGIGAYGLHALLADHRERVIDDQHRRNQDAADDDEEMRPDSAET